jgi:Na+-transporting methylmalonyl-CoA/oxaloacetate decarboxylase gamma subunit
MLIVFCFLLLLVAAMLGLNVALRRILPGLLKERAVDRKSVVGGEKPASPSEAEIVAAMVAAINARISAVKG